MPQLSSKKRKALGLRAARTYMFHQDKVWSRHSNDKVDIAGTLSRVIRTLCKALPLTRALTALSIGSSNEPQFRILESMFRGGLFLVDIEEAALDIVAERLRRQGTRQVQLVRGNYQELLRDADRTRDFRTRQLGGRRMNLITLHHSLYYSPRSVWRGLLTRLYRLLLAAPGDSGLGGAIHAVLMANQSDDPTTTTGLYNHFAGRFFGTHNDQNLAALAAEMVDHPDLPCAQVLHKASQVEFFVDDFERFMGVIWMILLHPNVHRFNPEQQHEVIEHVYTHLWSKGVPLVQTQDHVVIYRGDSLAGLI